MAFNQTVVILLACLMCVPVTAAVNPSVLATLDLEREFFSDRYIKLKVGDEDVLVMLQENTNAIARGVAILVTQSHTTLTSKHGLSPLVSELNELGWVTMLVPSPPTQFLTPRENIEPVTDSPSSLPSIKDSGKYLSQQTLDEHLQRLSVTMLAAIEKAKEYPGFILVIAQGTSAASLIHLYAEQSLPSPDAMVVIEPYWPDRLTNQKLAIQLASTSMPVLDFYSDGDNVWSASTVQKRKVATIRSLKLHYRQRKIIGLNAMDSAAPYISKEIYGWLSHMGW
ncbi:MAG: alpha/beta hydrolase family protein [Paraglaciecola sp.]|uniref:DUF3530 family protein n=1 Tax=Paraglaciecola sp. TaxID=1920173 RepID=UPI00273D4203|nr:DUF3530 family protein [Paraglaciecola sp.]MDP5032959.1 alpha/beta hydrolase family protein [Paraglaciecola sp.]MDP5133672.1 alpha/beta hydrolase family protein [Paraglaciecola sp.]